MKKRVTRKPYRRLGVYIAKSEWQKMTNHITELNKVLDSLTCDKIKLENRVRQVLDYKSLTIESDMCPQVMGNSGKFFVKYQPSK